MINYTHNHRPVYLSAAEINLIIEALEYTAEQTKISNGEINVWSADAPCALTNEDRIVMSEIAEDVADRLNKNNYSDHFLIDSDIVDYFREESKGE